jgi:hypothetical protein
MVWDVPHMSKHLETVEQLDLEKSVAKEAESAGLHGFNNLG